jgi:hypothetical protein
MMSRTTYGEQATSLTARKMCTCPAQGHGTHLAISPCPARREKDEDRETKSVSARLFCLCRQSAFTTVLYPVVYQPAECDLLHARATWGKSRHSRLVPWTSAHGRAGQDSGSGKVVASYCDPHMCVPTAMGTGDLGTCTEDDKTRRNACA